MSVHVRAIAVVSLGLLQVVACSASDAPGAGGAAGAAPSDAGQPGNSAGSVNANAGMAGLAQGGSGAPAQGGDAATTAGTSTGGASNGGMSSGGMSSGGMAGAAGAAGTVGAAGNGGSDPGDTPAPRPLNVTVGGMKQITHAVNGVSAGLDTRTTQVGKLVIDLGVTSGGYQPWLGKRGFHVMGVSFPMCDISNDQGRDHDGDCRLNTFDGVAHGTSSAVTPANSISGHVQAALKSLQQQFPTEDWGYFLNADDSVRWSDVAFTGMSHGATTAAVIGKAVRLYRVVSRSGPRDNACGLPGMAAGDFSRATPPWQANCPDASIASWLDAPSATPVARFFAMVGKQDVEYGDIMFAMERMKYPGEPIRWDVAGSVLTGTSRFYADAGHLDFLAAAGPPPRTSEALNIAFGVPVANQNPAF
ncbi:MAG TPA: hypothetical protein VGF76_13000 [Polyangiaceae bacterium]